MKNSADNSDYTDPFSAGQMVGMLVMLTFIENNGGISDDLMQQIKRVASDNAQQYLQKPSEDVLLMVESMVKDIEKL